MIEGHIQDTTASRPLRDVSMSGNSKNIITLRRLEPMTSISLKISLEVVHLTTAPLIHIYFYRIEIDKQGQCSGTITLWFLVGYNCWIIRTPL